MFNDHPIHVGWANELTILRLVRQVLKPTDAGLCNAIQVVGRELRLGAEANHLKWVIKKDLHPHDWLDSWIASRNEDYLTLPRATTLAKMYNTRLAWLGTARNWAANYIQATDHVNGYTYLEHVVGGQVVSKSTAVNRPLAMIKMMKACWATKSTRPLILGEY